MAVVTDIPFLGRGWSFPPRFSSDLHQVEMVAGEQDIAESLRVLLATRPGERLMVPTYGCDLHQFVFADLSTGLTTEIADAVAMAILRWEPRIDLLDITARADEQEQTLVRIAIDYRIRRTNVRSNLVFPFYLTEATLVAQP